jgi:predicted nucleic acid-binding protein
VSGVVSDASPLIALHQIGQLGLLGTIFGSVLIPPAVAREAASVERRYQKVAGGVTRTFIHDGVEVAEERLSTGGFTRYFHGGLDQHLASGESRGSNVSITN